MIQKKLSQLFSLSVNLLSSNLVFRVCKLNLVLNSWESGPVNIELNNMKIEGIPKSFLNSVLFNKAITIIHIWEGLRK